MPDDIVERMRAERAEKAKQRQAELDKYEAELAQRREARRAERTSGREKDKKSEQLFESMTKKTLADSIKHVEVKNVEHTLAKAQIQVKSKEIRNRNELDSETFSIRRKRMKELDISRRRRRIPPRLKRYMVHPAEFYGIDFSIDINLDSRNQELLDIQQNRMNELLHEPDKMRALIESGQAFIRAMTETVSGDGLKVQNMIKKKYTGSMNTVKEDEELTDDQVKELMDDVDGWFNSEKVDIITEKPVESSITKKKWNETIPKSKIDYSDNFGPNTGAVEGVTVYRIEDLKPKLLSRKTPMGTFCVGDCYIVLHTSVLPTGQLDWDIYQWVGEEATLDKKACSAIYSVGLRQMLCASNEIHREQSHDESDDFTNLFLGLNHDLVYVEAEKATASGLAAVEEREYPVLVYHFGTTAPKNRNIKLETGFFDEQITITGGQVLLKLVAPELSSLGSNRVILIDAGLLLYQWNGKRSTLTDRMKCRLFAEKICRVERPTGKADLFEVDERQEPEEFWDVFDGASRAIGASADDLSEGDRIVTPKLYLIDAKLEAVDVASINISSMLQKQSPQRKMLKSDGCCVLDCGTEVFLWIGRHSSPGLRHVAETLLVRRIFPTTPVARPAYTHLARFIETVEPETFKLRFADWDREEIKKVNFTEKKSARNIIAEFTKLVADDKTPIDIQALYSPPPTGKYLPAEEEFVETLFRQANSLLQNMQSFMFDRDRKKFIRLNDWSLDGGREKAHLWNEECYVFMCEYKRKAHGSLDSFDKSGSHASLDDDGPVEHECVTYIWLGRNSPKPSLGLLTFQFQFKHMIASIIARATGGKMDTRVVQLEQEKESLALLAHFDRECIIHSGKRPSEMKIYPALQANTKELYSSSVSTNICPQHVSLYHIRSDLRYHVSRAVQVAPMIASLSTRDCYLLLYKGANGNEPYSQKNCYLWIGRGASKDEERRALSVSRRIVEFRSPSKSNDMGSQGGLNNTTSRDRLAVLESSVNSGPPPFQVIKEKVEPRQFWTYLGPSFSKPPNPSAIPTGQGYYYSTPPPRMFRCSTENGFFQVKDLGFQYTANDMLNDSVCLLDSGPGLGRPHTLYGWVGKDASDVVIKMAKKSVDVYFDHLNDGRSLDRSDWDTSERNKKRRQETGRRLGSVAGKCDVDVVKQGQESTEFKAFFLGWGDNYAVDDEGKKLLKIADNDNLITTHDINKSEREPPTSAFLREQKRIKEEKRKAKAKASLNKA